MSHEFSDKTDPSLPTKEKEPEARPIGSGSQDERLRRLINRSPAGIVETDATGRMRFVNTRWCEMLGYRETELLDMTIDEITDPSSLDLTRQAFSAAQSDMDSFSIDKIYRRKDGTALVANSTISALQDIHGRFVGISAIVIDNSERFAIEQRLRESEQRLRKILDNTIALIGVLLPDGTLIEANAPAITMGGMERDDVIGRKFWECAWWTHDPTIVEELQQAITRAADGVTQRYDTIARMADDTRIPIDFMISPVLDDMGQVELLVPSALDISDRKRSEERLAFVSREVNHRSKNLLAVVQSMLRQMRPVEVGQFVQNFSERLRALSRCQDLLMQSQHDTIDLRELIDLQLAHFREVSDNRLLIDGPKLVVTEDVAQSLGMAMYELATNAAKYGALSNAAGQIEISWQVCPPDNGNVGEVFHLCWTERGGPPVKRPESTGFGTVVLQDMLSMALNAETAIQHDRDGVRWSLRCELGAILPR